MKYNYQKMDRQLAELEQMFHPPYPRGKVLRVFLGQEERDSLGPDDKIVEDHFEDAQGATVIRAQRIAADPSDGGKDYPHGCWNPKYLDANIRHPQQITGIVYWTKSHHPIGPRTRVTSPRHAESEV
jgi:hypothetical protein